MVNYSKIQLENLQYDISLRENKNLFVLFARITLCERFTLKNLCLYHLPGKHSVKDSLYRISVCTVFQDNALWKILSKESMFIPFARITLCERFSLKNLFFTVCQDNAMWKILSKESLFVPFARITLCERFSLKNLCLYRLPG